LSKISNTNLNVIVKLNSAFNLSLPVSVEEFLEKTGKIFLFAKRFFTEVFLPPFDFREAYKQSFSIGYKSLPLIGITGFIIGFTLTLQSIPTLNKFGAASLVPSMVAVAVLREIGPVISSLIFAGKIGSGIGAELGSMRVTEQIDAMEVSGTRPFRYLVVTRIIASTFTLPLLVIYADLIALLGGFIAVNISSPMNLNLYFMSAFSGLGFMDVIPATIKTYFFGFAIGLVGCNEGWNAARGTESVGIAANTAVVISSLMVIIIDMLAVQITSLL